MSKLHLLNFAQPIHLRLTLSIITILFLIGNPTGQADELPPTRDNTNAIFIIVDGIPADVIENSNTPSIDAISSIGGYTRAIVGGEVGGASESPTVSAVGYQSLITGTWSNKHNIYNNSPDAVNYDYWDIFRIAKAADQTLTTALFSTWVDNRTVLIGEGLEAAGGNKLDYYFDGFENDLERFPHDDAKQYLQQLDELVSREAARYIETQGPELSWVYLEYTDAVGHRLGDSPQMQQAVEWMDSRIGIIWNAVEQRAATTGEDWLLVVTTDHGRDAETGKRHGGQSERERAIWIATNSKNLNSNFNEETEIVDILPSITSHMGIAIPAEISKQLDGVSFIDAE